MPALGAERRMRSLNFLPTVMSKSRFKPNTFSYDPETLKSVELLSRLWQMSQSEVVRTLLAPVVHDYMKSLVGGDHSSINEIKARYYRLQLEWAGINEKTTVQSLSDRERILAEMKDHLAATSKLPKSSSPSRAARTEEPEPMPQPNAEPTTPILTEARRKFIPIVTPDGLNPFAPKPTTPSAPHDYTRVVQHMPQVADSHTVWIPAASGDFPQPELTAPIRFDRKQVGEPERPELGNFKFIGRGAYVWFLRDPILAYLGMTLDDLAIPYDASQDQIQLEGQFWIGDIAFDLICSFCKDHRREEALRAWLDWKREQYPWQRDRQGKPIDSAPAYLE